MLASIPASLLEEWRAFDALEPIDLRYRVDLNAGIVASTLANAFLSTKKRKEPYQPEEFMPQFRKPQKKTKAQDLYAEFRAWAMMLKGRKGKDADNQPA